MKCEDHFLLQNGWQLRDLHYLRVGDEIKLYLCVKIMSRGLAPMLRKFIEAGARAWESALPFEFYFLEANDPTPCLVRLHFAAGTSLSMVGRTAHVPLDEYTVILVPPRHLSSPPHSLLKGK